MSKDSQMILHRGETLPLLKNPAHPGVWQKKLMDTQEADKMNVGVNALLLERLMPRGGLLPHVHPESCEVICLTKGRVRAYYDGAWHDHAAGDVFIVPAGVLHAVVNQGDTPTEQLSFFLPNDYDKKNVWFQTDIQDAPSVKGLLDPAPDRAHEEESAQ